MRRAIADVQSLFSCLFALLLYAGSRTTEWCLVARLLKETGAAETEEREELSSVLLKACKGCGQLIPQTMRMCERCDARQQSRHVVYNNTRRDKRAAEFYISKEWRELRQVIMSVYEYVDIYALYVLHELITLKDSDPVHHIIELEEDWEQRLNPLNLIPISHTTHNTITALYKASDASMRATQTQLRSLIEYHFRGAGGYEKVLSNRFLVAPPERFGENSPREFQQIEDSEKGVRM